MKPERVVEPPIPFEGSPCDWLLSSDPDTKRWLTLHRDEVAELGEAAMSLAALRYLTHNLEVYFKGHKKWALWAGASEKTIERHVDVLVGHGYISCDGRQGPRHRRYKLSRAAPTTKDNDAYAVFPLGFLHRVKPFKQRVVFANVLSKFRSALGLLRERGVDTNDEEDFFNALEAEIVQLREATPQQASRNKNLIMHWNGDTCLVRKHKIMRLTSTELEAWGVPSRTLTDVKSKLREQDLICFNDETFVFPSGRPIWFNKIDYWL